MFCPTFCPTFHAGMKRFMITCEGTEKDRKNRQNVVSMRDHGLCGGCKKTAINSNK